MPAAATDRTARRSASRTQQGSFPNAPPPSRVRNTGGIAVPGGRVAPHATAAHSVPSYAASRTRRASGSHSAVGARLYAQLTADANTCATRCPAGAPSAVTSAP